MKDKIIQLCSHKDTLYALTESGVILKQEEVFTLKNKEVIASQDNIKAGAERKKVFKELE